MPPTSDVAIPTAQQDQDTPTARAWLIVLLPEGLAGWCLWSTSHTTTPTLLSKETLAKFRETLKPFREEENLGGGSTGHSAVSYSVLAFSCLQRTTG